MLYYVLLGVYIVDYYASFRAPESQVLGHPKRPCDCGVTGEQHNVGYMLSGRGC